MEPDIVTLEEQNAVLISEIVVLESQKAILEKDITDIVKAVK